MTKHQMPRWRFVFIVVVFLQFYVAQAESSELVTVEQTYPGFAAGILKRARMVAMKKGTLLVSEGIEIKESQIKETVEKAGPKIREELRKNLFFILEQETMKAVLVEEARSSGAVTRGLSQTEAIQAYLSQKFRDVQVADEEAKTFYEANKAMVGGLPFEQVKEAIQQVLVQQKRQDAFASYLQGLGGKKNIRVNREWVKAQYVFAKDNPVDKARMSGKPTMVEFGATGCIPCDMMQPILDKLRKNYSDRLNVVFVHVRENQILGARFGIQSIPVQVFYDRNGEEVFRHVGFYAEPEVLRQLAKLGVE
ncbi:MAG: thioredoxin family protein [Desulfobacteraceae bacterium]|nr:MAG: thioredoxin family protein [Desulfobacteraceae bacterium]